MKLLNWLFESSTGLVLSGAAVGIASSMDNALYGAMIGGTGAACGVFIASRKFIGGKRDLAQQEKLKVFENTYNNADEKSKDCDAATVQKKYILPNYKSPRTFKTITKLHRLNRRLRSGDCATTAANLLGLMLRRESRTRYFEPAVNDLRLDIAEQKERNPLGGITVWVDRILTWRIFKAYVNASLCSFADTMRKWIPLAKWIVIFKQLL